MKRIRECSVIKYIVIVFILYILWNLKKEIQLIRKSVGTSKGSKESSRYRAYYNLLYRWMLDDSYGSDLSGKIKSRDISSIYIYGTGTLGKLLYNKIKTAVVVEGFIDRGTESVEEEVFIDGIPVKGLSSVQDSNSVIIVSPVFDYEEIKKELKSRGCRGEIISLESIVFNLD